MQSSAPSPQLLDLAQQHGVAVDYWDWQGNHVQVSDATIRAVLAAMDVEVDEHGNGVESADAASKDPWGHTLAPSLVIRAGWTSWVPVHVPDGASVSLTLVQEDGVERQVGQVDHWVQAREVDGRLIGEATFELPGDIPLGWHRLVASVSGDHGDALPGTELTLIVTPHRIDTADRLAGQRIWGLQEQVYQVRSEQSWGIGDLHDLATTLNWAGQLGADFTLINPMHASSPVPPIEPSPYLPTTRRFGSPIYLSVEDLPELDTAPADVLALIDDLRTRAHKLNGFDLIDHDAVFALKDKALRALYAVGTTPERAAAFAAYRQSQGEALQDFATYCALATQHGSEWPAWPVELRSPKAPAVLEFAAAHADEVSYHAWLQWLLRAQLDRAQSVATYSGMSMGVVHDLAVGVHPGGADAWSMQDALALGVSVGAPPDQFNQRGQDWSQPPLRPDALARLGYAPLRDMLRAALGRAGGIRIDHIIGLFRLWWIPQGAGADQGTYVRYDAEAIVGIVALEAQRAGAVVIGEDLGVVEPSVRTVLAERGILGTSILWFEWENDQPMPPEHYRQLCLATVTTHDLPPSSGYLQLEHVAIRDQLGLLTRSVEDERAHELVAIDKVLATLEARGLRQPDSNLSDTIEALHAFIGQTPSMMLGVAIADLAGDKRAINQPGTHREYPNWSIPLAGPDGTPLTLERLMASTYPARIAHRLNPPEHE